MDTNHLYLTFDMGVGAASLWEAEYILDRHAECSSQYWGFLRVFIACQWSDLWHYGTIEPFRAAYWNNS